jgi:HK97 family phage portal protein
MSLLRNLIAPRESRSISFQDVWGRGLDLDGTSTAGGRLVNEDSALRLTTVYGCVSLLADMVATLPVDAYRKTPDGVRELIEPKPTILSQPARFMSWIAWTHAVVASLALRGNAYAMIVRNAAGTITELPLVHPDDVEIVPNGTSWIWMVKGQPVTHYDLLHIPLFTTPSSPVGLSPISYHAESIGGALAVEEYGNRFFGDSAMPSGVLETDSMLTPEQAETLAATWQQRQGHRRRKPAVLQGGLKWRPITIAPEEAQFIETRKMNSREISGKVYRVPPHMIGDVDGSTSWGTGIEQQTLGFVKFTLMPYLVRIEEALSAIMTRTQYVKFNTDGLLRGDATSRANLYASALEHGWMSPNEVRALEEMAPIDDGDRYFFPLNFGPLDSTDTIDATDNVETDPMDPVDTEDTPDTQARSVEDSTQSVRAVDLTVPQYIRDAAERGLALRAEGYGGDGLVERTIAEARQMAAGVITENKVIRANAWAARHKVDLQAEQNTDPNNDGWPGAGAVAHYLWGIDPINPEPARAWFERKSAAIAADEES